MSVLEVVRSGFLTSPLEAMVLTLPILAMHLLQVGDLGLAQRKGANGLYKFNGCTINYMAPEMAQHMLPWLYNQPITGNVSALSLMYSFPAHALTLYASGEVRGLKEGTG